MSPTRPTMIFEPMISIVIRKVDMHALFMFEILSFFKENWVAHLWKIEGSMKSLIEVIWGLKVYQENEDPIPTHEGKFSYFLEKYLFYFGGEIFSVWRRVFTRWKKNEKKMMNENFFIVQEGLQTWS